MRELTSNAHPSTVHFMRQKLLGTYLFLNLFGYVTGLVSLLNLSNKRNFNSSFRILKNF